MSGPILDPAMFSFNLNKLCEQRVFTDFNAGEIMVNIPVTPFGEEDPMRIATFYGRATLNMGGQPLRLQFAIPGNSLPDAITKFPEAVQGALTQAYENSIRQQLAAPVQNVQLDLSRLKN